MSHLQCKSCFQAKNKEEYTVYLANCKACRDEKKEKRNENKKKVDKVGKLLKQYNKLESEEKQRMKEEIVNDFSM